MRTKLLLLCALLSQWCMADGTLTITLTSDNTASQEAFKTAFTTAYNALEDKTNVTVKVVKGDDVSLNGTTLDYVRWATNGTNTLKVLDLTGSGLAKDFTASLSWNAMSGSSITTVKLPEISSIPNVMFYGMNNLTSVTIGTWTLGSSPCTLTSIGSEAFSNCTALPITGSPAFTVTGTVGESAFRNCDAITYFPYQGTKNNPVTATSYSVADCDGLTEIHLPATIGTLRSNLFDNCANLTKINVNSDTPNQIWGVTSIESNVASNCPKFAEWTVAGDNQNYSAEGGLLYDKQGLTLINCPVAKEIGETFTFKGTVTTIGEKAFYGCQKLTTVKLPTQVTTIKSEAFDHSTITSLILDKTIQNISNTFINHCPELTSIAISGTDGGTSGDYFASAGGILYQKQTDGYHLAACPAKIATTDGVLNLYNVETELGAGAKVTHVGMNNADGEAFYQNTTIKTLILPDNVTNIHDRAFYNCNIEQLAVPYHFKTYGVNILVECKNFAKYYKYAETTNTWTELTDEESGLHYDVAEHMSVNDGGVLYSADIKTLYSVPAAYKSSEEDWDGHFIVYNNVEKLHAACFQYTQNIKRIDIAQGIMAIPHQCFSNSNVEQILIPNSVVQLGQDMIQSCSKLTDIYYLPTSKVVPLNQSGTVNCFYGAREGNAITVHFTKGYDGLIDAYKTTQDASYGWHWLSSRANFTADIEHRALFDDADAVTGFDKDGADTRMDNPISSYSLTNLRDDANAKNSFATNTKYQYITLYRSFASAKDNEYSTLALPFSLTRAQVKKAFGPNAKLYKFTGRYNNIVKFETVSLSEGEDNEVIVTNGVAMLIQPQYKHLSYLLPLDTEVNIFSTLTTSTMNSEAETDVVQTTTGNTTTNTAEEKQTDVTFKHGFYATYQNDVTVPAGFYYVKADGTVMWATKQRNITKAFRGYIRGNENETESNGAKVTLAFQFDEDEPTAIVSTGDGRFQRMDSSNVYSLDGRLVRPAGSQQQLQKGIYVVNGKKIVIK